MKDVLIYATLAAILISASIGLITSMSETFTTQGNALNQELESKTQALINSINNGSNSSTNSN
jgi:hypothetical protein